MATIDTLSRTSGRTSVATKPSARTISTTLHDPDSITLTCATRGSRARAAASISWHKRDLARERDRGERIVAAVHRAVGARRRRRGGALGGIEQFERLRGAVDRRGADFVGVGEGGHLARHAAQAEARIAVIIGGLQPAVVEPERFGQAILEVEFAIVMRGEVARGEALRLVGIELRDRGSCAGRRSRCGRRPVGGAALEHEAAVAIAAIDEPGLVVDVEIDARMAERGVDHARRRRTSCAGT